MGEASKRDIKTTILVHPGSFFVSGALQVSSEIFEEALELLKAELDAADKILVIDGFLSDYMPIWAQDLIPDEDERITRIWGCDSGEPASDYWLDCVAHGDIEASSQEAAIAEAVLAGLVEGQISCAGAWSTRDGSSGCVNSVFDALVEIGIPNVRLSDARIFEEDIAAEPDGPGF